MPEQMDRWMTTDDVAEYLQLNVQTVRKLLRSGEIESRMPGQKYRVKKEWADDWMMGQYAQK